jgi:DNA-directed RNA polymerase specialized sigma24 family protein
VLFVITARKVADVHEAEGRLKRGGGQIVQSLAGADWAQMPVASADPDPAEATMLAEQAERLLDLLPDAILRQIAVWKLEGYANHEIAQRLGRSEPTVERKLRRIREAWQAYDR